MATPKRTGGIDLEGAVELWRTPSSSDDIRGAHPHPDQKAGQHSLVTQTENLWQTPATDSFRSRGGDRKDEMGLDQQARLQWVTPATRDWKGANSELHVTETGGGRRHMDQLSNQVEHSFRPDQPTESNGQPSSESAPTSPRRLNPKFVEWLQGLPEGWTSAAPISSEALETWSSQSRELLRSLCS